MHKALIVISVAVAGLFSTAPLAPTGQPSTTETIEVTEAGTPVGAAALVRTRQSATFRVNTTMLEPNSAYTVWVAAFNFPENCSGDCNGPDIAAADGSVFFGTAFVTGSGGTANVEFQVTAGDLPEGTVIANGHDVGINPGNGLDVELHVIIAAHGPNADVMDWPFELSSPGPPEQVALFK